MRFSWSLQQLFYLFNNCLSKTQSIILNAFLKVCLNIIPTNEDENENNGRKSAGINKLIIIALAEEACESYENLELIFSLLNLNGLCGIAEYCVSADLKLIMIVLGLQTCSSMHPCAWCNAKSGDLLQKGELRTFETIENSYLSWKTEGKEKKGTTKNFGNFFEQLFVSLYRILCSH